MSEAPHRVGVTGPRGFIAGRVIERLRHDERYLVVPWDRSAWESPQVLRDLASECDTILHLAGVNRGDQEDVYRTNCELAEKLVAACEAAASTPRVVFSSTTQRDAANAYGRGKLRAERVLSEWSTRSGAALTTLIVPNVYGAGCRPFYNSVVATFCHQITHDESPRLIEDREIEFLWVNDLVDRLLAEIASPASGARTERVVGGAHRKVSELLATLEGFRREYFELGVVSDLSCPFRSSMYTTFLSHLEPDDHLHRSQLHSDPRGELCEVIKLAGAGQVFFSTTRPGVTRGNHYHTRKIEWFCVVQGEAIIRLRPVGQSDLREHRVCGGSPEFVSIPVMHTHSIENVGESDLLTLFWTNELFNPGDADTYYESVLPEAPPAGAHAA